MLRIPEIDFFRDPRIWGSRDELAPVEPGQPRKYIGSWPHDIFTEIVIEPGERFLSIDLSPSAVVPAPGNHYHITLTHTYDVGKGFDWQEGEIREWVRNYELIRQRYDGRRARLGMDRWGNGYTFYIDTRTRVEGLSDQQNLFDDPQVNFVFHVPNKLKAGDGMHVSMKI